MSNTLSKLWRLFSHHKGLGGDEAHPPVDGLVSGFMTPELLAQHNQLFSTRNFITADDDVGVEILSLEPGFYSSNRFKGGPTSTSSTGNIDRWLAHLDVYKGYSNSRIYVYTTSSNGDRWYLTAHNSNNVNNGSMKWIKLVSEVVLWEGENSLTSPLELTGQNCIYRNGAWLYSGFRIEYTDSFGNPNVASSVNSNRNVFCFSGNVGGSTLECGLEECLVTFGTDNRVAKTNNFVRRLLPTVVGTQADVAVLRDGASAFKIRKIVGIK
ncbi:hypothetical protein HQ956_09980 [Enterococcus faecium]|nr:hypothetical protein [Enterococcus faecium]